MGAAKPATPSALGIPAHAQRAVATSLATANRAYATGALTTRNGRRSARQNCPEIFALTITMRPIQSCRSRGTSRAANAAYSKTSLLAVGVSTF